MPEAPLSAEEIAHRGFPSTFRGFDPAEVRAYLVRVSNELKAATARERELQQRVTEAERRAANPVIDQAMLTRALGEETSRVLVSAQDAAHDLKARSEQSVAGILREAHEKAQAIRAAAEAVLAERTDEAEAAAGEIRAHAQAEAEAVVERARREAEATRVEVAEQAQHMVHEAQAARARVLGDLTRRRRIAHMQVEQLRAGRERLLDAYRVVRRTLDEVADELERVESEARSAASAAGLRAEEAMGSPQAAAEELDVAADELGSTGLEVDEPATHTPAASAPDVEDAGGPPPPTAAEPEPTTRAVSPPPAPVVAREDHAEERKLSSLRILGRPRSDGLPGPELEVLEAPSDLEGVRVVAASVEPDDRPDWPRREEPEPPSITPGISWTPAPVPVPEPAPPPEPTAPASEPAPPTPSAPESVSRAPEPPPAGSDPPAVPDPPVHPPASPVDAIFARIRADRGHGVDRPGQVRPVGVTAPAGDTGSPTSSLPGRADAEPDPAASPSAPVAEAGVKLQDRDEWMLQRRDEAVEAIEVALTRKLKRALQDDHNDVLDRLRSCRGVPDTRAFLPSAADQAARYAAAAGQLLREAAESGASFVSPQASDAGDPEIADVVVDLTEALVGPLRRSVERGVAGGNEDASVIVDCIGAAYRECKSQRLEALAEDAVVAAFSRGTVSAAAQATLRWVVDDGDRACPDCDDNALAGPTPSGQKYPTGQSHPPAHAGCRCLLVLSSP